MMTIAAQTANIFFCCTIRKRIVHLFGSETTFEDRLHTSQPRKIRAPSQQRPTKFADGGLLSTLQAARLLKML